jgi:hypothetical protein
VVTIRTGNSFTDWCHIDAESVRLPVDKVPYYFTIDCLNVSFYTKCILLLVDWFLRAISYRQVHIITTSGLLVTFYHCHCQYCDSFSPKEKEKIVVEHLLPRILEQHWLDLSTSKLLLLLQRDIILTYFNALVPLTLYSSSSSAASRLWSTQLLDKQSMPTMLHLSQAITGEHQRLWIYLWSLKSSRMVLDLDNASCFQVKPVWLS